jgi:hypothetical protein
MDHECFKDYFLHVLSLGLEIMHLVSFYSGNNQPYTARAKF